jgi:hypothetical protein
LVACHDQYGVDSFTAVLTWMMPFFLGSHLRLGSSIGRRSLLSARLAL